MRHNVRLGLAQGIFVPLPRPNHEWLSELGTTAEEAPDSIRPAAFSASSMWACHAATVSPAPATARSAEHTSELHSLILISYGVFCLHKKTTEITTLTTHTKTIKHKNKDYA